MFAKSCYLFLFFVLSVHVVFINLNIHVGKHQDTSKKSL